MSYLREIGGVSAIELAASIASTEITFSLGEGSSILILSSGIDSHGVDAIKHIEISDAINILHSVTDLMI